MLHYKYKLAANTVNSVCMHSHNSLIVGQQACQRDGTVQVHSKFTTNTQQIDKHEYELN